MTVRDLYKAAEQNGWLDVEIVKVDSKTFEYIPYKYAYYVPNMEVHSPDGTVTTITDKVVIG